jgi:hypothetical protein
VDLGPETWFVIRESSFSLTKHLRDHIRIEDDVVARCSRVAGRLDAEALNGFAIEHHETCHQFQTLNWLLRSEPSGSLEELRPLLTKAIDQLRQDMSEQERLLFPVLERLLASHASIAQDRLPAAPRLAPTLTVGQVAREYPKALGVLDRFRINPHEESSDTLEEAAWYRGLDHQLLLVSLEEAIAAPDVPDPVAG